MNKRILSVILAMLMALALLPLSSAAGWQGETAHASRSTAPAADANAAPMRDTSSATVLAFSSDVHNKAANESANRMSVWLDNVIDIYGHIDQMGFCGDMGDANVSGAAFWTCSKTAMDVVSDHGIPAVYTTGNHEFYNGSFDTTDDPVKDYYTVGEECANENSYRIYALGTSNWNNSTDNYTQEQADALADYFDSVDNSKPIIVLTHFPLHYYKSGSYWWSSSRTIVNAELIIDALNAGAASGKTIILLWGHNHTLSDSNYDEMMAPGCSIEYASGSTKTLQCYYGSAGCMSDVEYGTGSAYVKGKGLIITIDGDELDFHYYDADGNDVTENPLNPQPTAEPTAAPTQDPSATPTPAPAGELESGKKYVILADDGYALTKFDTDASFYNTGSSSSQRYNYTGLDGVVYDPENITSDMLWTAQASGSGWLFLSEDGLYLNGTYTSNSTGGYDGDLSVDTTQDVWVISNGKLKSTNASSTASSDKYLAHSNGSSTIVDVFTVRSSSSAATITFYEYTDGGASTAEPTAEPTAAPTAAPTAEPGTTEIRFIETDHFESGQDYIVASADTEAAVNALTYGSSTVSSTALAVIDGSYIVTEDTAVVWTRTSSDYLQNGSKYLYPTSSNGVMTYSGGRPVYYSNGHISFSTSSSGTYYLTYSGGSWSTANNEASAAVIRIFVRTEVPVGETCTVTFVDWDGTVIDAQTVNYGEAAAAPADPAREGYTFTGWDVDFTEVTGDMTVTAQYQINTYTVTFIDWDGTVIDTQTVNYGEAAAAPADPAREGYTFTGWDADFTEVTGDMTVTAQYQINTYTVIFVDWDGTVIDAQTVNYGEAATAPADPAREGYTFIGWDADFTEVTGDMTVTAQYEQNAPAGLIGDVDCDGDVDFDDVTLLNAYLLNAAELSEQGLANANVNGDNKVSSADVVALNKLILGSN